MADRVAFRPKEIKSKINEKRRGEDCEVDSIPTKVGRLSPLSSESSDSLDDVLITSTGIGGKNAENDQTEKEMVTAKKKYYQKESTDQLYDGKEIGIPTNGNKKDDIQRADKRLRPNSYKAYHRQIERRRRSKINDMINEIASLVPMCQNVSHRLDKLSILELAVQHMRMVTSSNYENSLSSFKPQLLKDEEVKYLLENNTDGFLLVLSCDKSQILYVSEAVSKSTLHTPLELVGRSLLELVHSKDVPIITSALSPYPQLPIVGKSVSQQNIGSSYNVNSFNNRVNETGEKGSSMIGAKRSFYFRLKTSKQPQFDASKASKSHRYKQSLSGNSMITVHCSGFLKSWQTSSQPLPVSGIDADIHLSTFACFIAVAKPLPEKDPFSMENVSSNIRNDYESNENAMPLHYSSRHSADAKYLYVDERVFPLAGYLPQDLVGNCEYKFVHKDDVKVLSETYKQALENRHQERFVSDVYRFKMKHGGLLPIRTVAFSLFNPFTKELEFVLHENFILEGKEVNGVMNKSVYGPTNKQRLELKAKCDAVGRIHDEANTKTSTSSNGQMSILKPLSMNVLKHCGINTDILNEILKKHNAKPMIKQENIENMEEHDQYKESCNSPEIINTLNGSDDMMIDHNDSFASASSEKDGDKHRTWSSGYCTGENSG